MPVSGLSINADCGKLTDGNPSTFVAFTAFKRSMATITSAQGGITGTVNLKKNRPTITFSYNHGVRRFQQINIFKHPLEHTHRLIRSFEIHCKCGANTASHMVQAFSDLHAMPEWVNAKGWVGLSIRQQCPCSAKVWVVKDLRACARVFHVHGIYLSYGKLRLPNPAGTSPTTLHGWCAHHQAVKLGATKETSKCFPHTNNDRDSLSSPKTMASFVADVSALPPSSRMTTQLMFERVWPVKIRRTMRARGLYLKLMQGNTKLNENKFSLSMGKLPSRYEEKSAYYVSTNLKPVSIEGLMSNKTVDVTWQGQTHSAVGQICCHSWGCRKHSCCSAFGAKGQLYITYW